MRATPVECDAVADLLDAFADAELPPAAASEVRRHLAACPACAAEIERVRRLRAMLAPLRRDEAPAPLRDRLLAALPAATGRGRRRAWAAAAAAGIAGLALGRLGAPPWRGGPDVAQELLTAHARALLAEAPPQVAAGDPHRVRPWLSARLPVAPQVAGPEGFDLLGARLDLVGGAPVAAVLYRRRAHAITVFAAPAGHAGDWPAAPEARQGFNLLPWVRDGVRYVVVSDLNAGELALLRRALGG